MSEQDQEQVEPVEPTPDEAEEAAEDEPETPFEEPPSEEELPPEQPESRDDADVDPRYSKLETKAKNYTKGVAELLEDGGIPVAGCEMCADCYPGIRWLRPEDELHAMLLSVVRAEGFESPLPEDRDAVQCDRCNGWGATKLPSRVPGNEQRICRQCNGAGYLDPTPESGALHAPSAAPTNGSSEPLPGVPTSDPAVIDLMARGYLVVPPSGPVTTEQA